MCLKVTAICAVAVVVAYAWQQSAPSRRSRPLMRLAAQSLAIVAAMESLGGADPWGWVHGLVTPTSVWDPLTPANELLLLLAHLARWSGVAAPLDLVTVLHVALALLGAAIAFWICQGTSRRDPCLTAAYLVADLAVCGPVLWPWYLAPVVVLLLMSTTGRGWLLAGVLGAAAALWALPLPVVEMQWVAFASQLGGIACVGALALLSSRGLLPALPPVPPTPRRPDVAHLATAVVSG
jgi:hypothetical protein